ncbi:myotubularin-related protein 9-like isoform X4 [Apus apus]|uniref:myotubularin-related protein 9-like isoform X4 n=1 Tax=Apus apus TaxID=8895 RepID=UPI0021F89BA1|nr:myotubularin-related protein 9-like isoform X4 [Apus apus]
MEFSELIKTATVENVLLSCAGLPAVKGTLCITSHHLLLSSCPGGDAQPGTLELWLLIRNVDAVEKSVQNFSWYQPPRTNGSPRDTRLAGSSGTITLRCKDLKVLQLEIPGMEECLNIASSIEALSSVDSVMMMYPFFYRPENLKLEEGWHLFPLQQYFQQISSQTSQWRLSDVNQDFTTCPTYPPAVIVPAAVDDDTLRKVARYRQGGRFPVLSYYHPKNGTALLRSSQPLTGPNRKRCQEDELLLGTVLRQGERGFVIDTRSAQAAKQARMTGGGTEPKSSYPQWRRLHRPLERGRPLQESFTKLVEACNDTSISMDRWLSRLESCRWLSHVKAALSTACLAAQCLDREEASALVHGAEGTDTTLLVTALAQLILEPSCRTLTGFQGLLEREWIQFSERLLLTLFDNAYASAYGTFLCNNEKERCLCKVKENTHSLWAWLNQPGEKKKYLNPLYSPNTLVIWPSVEPQSIQLWQGLFFRWIRSSQYLDEAWAEIQQLVDPNESPVKESRGNRLSRTPSSPAAPMENKN